MGLGFINRTLAIVCACLKMLGHAFLRCFMTSLTFRHAQLDGTYLITANFFIWGESHQDSGDVLYLSKQHLFMQLAWVLEEKE